jgi:hypothetical protein
MDKRGLAFAPAFSRHGLGMVLSSKVIERPQTDGKRWSKSLIKVRAICLPSLVLDAWGGLARTQDPG